MDKNTSLENIAKKIRDMSEDEVLGVLEKATELPGEKRVVIKDIFYDFANDRDFFSLLGINYSNPSHRDLNRLMVLSYLIHLYDERLINSVSS